MPLLTVGGRVERKERRGIARAETSEDGGTYGVAIRRFTDMGYGGTKEYVQALRDIVLLDGHRTSRRALLA